MSHLGTNMTSLLCYDVQLKDLFVNYVRRKTPDSLLGVVTICLLVAMVLGLLGNAYLYRLCRTELQLTRDGHYISKLTRVDMLVCLFVLPYCILYEDR